MSHTVKSALAKATEQLADYAFCDQPGLDARLLVQHATGLSHTQLITRDTDAISNQQQAQIDALILRRQAGEPIAYLIGHWGFYDFELSVNKHVLVPRPETELLVDWTLECIKNLKAPRICDLGTGSGAIALVIAQQRPDASVVAVDFSAKALEVAKQNAHDLNINNIEFIESSWLDQVTGQFDCIVSNPPYIAANEAELALLQHEPQSALIAANNGLKDIGDIIDSAFKQLAPNAALLFEHGHQQAERVAALLLNSGFGNIQTRNDLSGTPRFTGGYKVGSTL